MIASNTSQGERRRAPKFPSSKPAHFISERIGRSLPRCALNVRVVCDMFSPAVNVRWIQPRAF